LSKDLAKSLLIDFNNTWPDLIFVTNFTNQVSREKIGNVEKFQLSMHDNCGEI